MNFRYDHLLTPVDPADLTPNSQSQSLCDVIEGQHKLHRTPTHRESPMFAFQNFYTQNFSAAKELERIDRINRTNCEANDNDGQLFSLEYNSYPANRSSDQHLAEPPVQMVEPRQNIAPKEVPINRTNPMAINEHKYSKWNHNYKKLQSPQSSVTAASSSAILKSSAGFPNSQKTAKSPKPFYNRFHDVPMSPAGNVDRATSFYTNPLVDFEKRHTSDWFQSSEHIHQAASSSNSQIGYNSSTHREGFMPSQTGWKSGFYW